MGESIPSDAVIDAWVRLVKAQHKLLGQVEADLKHAGFPPLGWYDVLLELNRAQEDGSGSHGLRPLELEGRLLLAQHNVSRLLARMAAAGLISRRPCADDGRGQIVAISKAGRALLKKMWPAYRAAIQRHVGASLDNDADARLLGQLLGRLLGIDETMGASRAASR